MSLLKATIIGRIGHQSIRKTRNNNEICWLKVATDMGFGEGKKTQWTSVAITSAKRVKEYAERDAVGDMIYAEGTLDLGAERQDDGTYTYSPVIFANVIQTVARKRRDNAESEKKKEENVMVTPEDVLGEQFSQIADNDDLPWDVNAPL